ncbi:uncharacterized protein LOC144350488 [Saccoglossus kowalevskii]
MSEIQRIVWLLSTLVCTEVKVFLTSQVRNTKSAKTRQIRDHNDLMELVQFRRARNPFTNNSSLCSIATGVDYTVNVDNDRSIGAEIIKSMIGKSVSDFSFTKKEQAKTLSVKTSLKLDADEVQVDPQLLFQRYVSIARGIVSTDELSSLFTYELCTHPPALFASDGLMREANKSDVWKCVGPITSDMSFEVKYVIHGGSLLQRIHGHEN